MLEGIKRIGKSIIDYLLTKKWGLRWVLLIVVIGAIFWLHSTEFYREILGEARWNIKTTKKYDIYYADIKLRTGKMLVQPQITVTYKDVVVFILNIDGLYHNNSASVSSNSKKSIKMDFQFEVLEDDSQIIQELTYDFESILAEKCYLNRDYKVNYECVAICNYQPYSSNSSRTRYVLFSDSIIATLSKKEADKRCSQYFYDIRSYKNMSTLMQDDEFMKNIDTCVDCIEAAKEGL